MKELYVTVERPDGSTYVQKIEWREGETVQKALNRFKKMIGKKYYICDWEVY